MLDKIKGAIFDMDGTLINSLIFWDVLWDDLGEKFLGGKKVRPTPQEDKNMRTMTLHDAMCYLYSIYHIGEDAEKLAEYALEKLGRFYITDVKIKEGAKEFLEYCKEKGVKMCVASASTKEHITETLKHLGIDKYFGEIFSCEEVGKGKEEPDVYLCAIKYLGTEKEETCVFEDSLTAIKTAGKIGIKTVGVYDKYNYGQEEMKKLADEYIDDGETLLKLI